MTNSYVLEKEVISIITNSKTNSISYLLVDKENRSSVLTIKPEDKLWDKRFLIKIGDLIPFRRTLKEELA